MATTYAFKAIVGAFADPDTGVFPFAGQEGMKHITIFNATDRTVHDTAADGTVMVSYVAGASGAAEIECQQNSTLNLFLIQWANTKFTQSETGGAANFAAASLRILDTLSGARHTLTGISPLKVPDKSYGPAGASVTWRLMAANVVSD